MAIVVASAYPNKPVPCIHRWSVVVCTTQPMLRAFCVQAEDFFEQIALQREKVSAKLEADRLGKKQAEAEKDAMEAAILQAVEQAENNGAHKPVARNPPPCYRVSVSVSVSVSTRPHMTTSCLCVVACVYVCVVSWWWWWWWWWWCGVGVAVLTNPPTCWCPRARSVAQPS